MNSNIFKLVISSALLISISGCNSIGNTTQGPIKINSSRPSIVILGQRHVSHKLTEMDYIDCIGKNLKERSAGVNIISEHQFVDSLYPYFEHSTAPLNINSFKQIAQDSAVAKKLDDLNLRYLVWVNGNTQISNSNGAVSCAIGPGAAGCIGFAKWDDEANYTASVWDIDKLTLSGNVNTSRSGTSYLPAVVVPIPILSGVQNSACNDMARRIDGFMTY